MVNERPFICGFWGLQPAPGHRQKDKLVELPKELAGSSDDVTLDVRSSDATDVRCILAHPVSGNRS